MADADEPTASLAPTTPRGAEQDEPFALRFAWLIVAGAATVSIGLVVAQLGWDWPFDPTRTTTTAQVLDSDGRVIELTTSEADGGGAREALFRTVAGIAALTAGLLAWGRLEQSRRQHVLDREAAGRAVDAQTLATRAQQATERGQITERFTTAVEQLGHTDRSVRLGGLFALEALAHDSKDDRQAITEVICAYARHHSIRRHPDGTEVLVEVADGDPVKVPVDGKDVDYTAAITIALRLPADWSLPIRNLRDTVVADLNVDSLGLKDDRLGAVDFSGATFTGSAFLGGKTFSDTTLFLGATFTGRALFVGATFTGLAWFNGTTFTDDVMFQGATFTGRAWFNGATFTNAWFNGATFTDDAVFNEAAFTGLAWFNGATFNGETSFNGVAVTGTASFNGATVTGTALFNGATVTDGLILPSGVDPGPQFRPDPADPTKWYRREGDPASPSTSEDV